MASDNPEYNGPKPTSMATLLSEARKPNPITVPRTKLGIT